MYKGGPGIPKLLHAFSELFPCPPPLRGPEFTPPPGGGGGGGQEVDLLEEEEEEEVSLEEDQMQDAGRNSGKSAV
jgi:hypothetical protein